MINNKQDKLSVLKKSLTVIISVLLWLLIWEVSSHIIDLDFIFPCFIKTTRKLSALILTLNFWKIVSLSILRIILGLLLGVIVAIVLFTISVCVPITKIFISVGMTVVKSTPVASVVMILWVLLGSGNLPSVIALLMVSPIIWQNLINGYEIIDKNLLEVASVFNFSWKKKLRLIIIPALTKYFIPAALTSVGLAWKSGIAAEIISYTKNSIGENIYDAKTYFEGDLLLSWTLVVIIISLIFEFAVKKISRRFEISGVKNSKSD